MAPEIKRQTFPDSVEEEIGKHAIEYANLGEEALWDLIFARNRFHLGLVEAMSLGELGSEDILKGKDALAVMNEIIFRARVILQMTRRDDLSQLNAIREELEKKS